jgi:chemotaxis protein MotA
MPTFSRPASKPHASGPAMGAAFGFVIVVASIALSANGLLAFFSLGGLIIVVGGVIAVAFMSFQASDVRKALDGITRMLRTPDATHDSLQYEVKKVTYWAQLMKVKTVRDFESCIDESNLADPFLKYGINMVLSEYAPEDLRAMLKTAADAAYERDCIPVDVLRAMAGHAPAFGMVGTLVGMVTMLGSLSDSLPSVGSTLAVAFLSTLYGVLSARMIYMPAAARLQQEADNRCFHNTLLTEGLVMLGSKKSPMHIQDRLNAFLQPEHRNFYRTVDRPTEAIVMPIRPSPRRPGEADIVIPSLTAVGA